MQATIRKNLVNHGNNIHSQIKANLSKALENYSFLALIEFTVATINGKNGQD